METLPFLLVALLALCIMPTAFGIDCYECTNQPGAGTKCSDPRVGKIKCLQVYDRCMTIKYTMSLGQNNSVSIEQRNCSNSLACDPKSDYYTCTLTNITGMLTDCSLACCQGDLCNAPFNSTKQVTLPPPTSAGLGLAASFGVILSALVLYISA
ncbi:uncharacterized protein LOC144628915 [Oculina patagonica]